MGLGTHRKPVSIFPGRWSHWHSVDRAYQHGYRATEEWGRNRTRRVQSCCPYSISSFIFLKMIRWKTLLIQLKNVTLQLGHRLKYYLNKFHFLKNTGPFRNFLTLGRNFIISKTFSPTIHGISDGLKKMLWGNGWIAPRACAGFTSEHSGFGGSWTSLSYSVNLCILSITSLTMQSNPIWPAVCKITESTMEKPVAASLSDETSGVDLSSGHNAKTST